MKKYLLLPPFLTIAALSLSSHTASASFFGDIFKGVKKAGEKVGSTVEGAGKTVTKGVVQIGKDAYADRFKWAGVAVQGASEVVGAATYGISSGAEGGGLEAPHMPTRR